MFICFVALILASYIRHIRDTKPAPTGNLPCGGKRCPITSGMTMSRSGVTMIKTPDLGKATLACIPACQPTLLQMSHYGSDVPTFVWSSMVMSMFLPCSR